ncbi:putative transcriptional regulatory protein [Scheffersomyces xylosifermentans]|uniref:putative transcriptional regulatory protein n=1 Tax=Scheffersomyces xylosifermentans TaxID=1304137 RepID=UPI00315DC5D6
MSTITKVSKPRRPRVDLACERCRQRKTRCDGAQPTCGTCTKRGISCVYGKRFPRAQVTVEYVKTLEEKLNSLTANADTSMDRRTNGSSSTVNPENSINRRAIPNSDSISTNNQIPPEYHQNPASYKDEDSSADAMGAGSVSTRKSRDKNFYGSSAAISFMKDLSSAVDNGKSSDSEDMDVNSSKYTMSRNDKNSSTRKLSDMVVPPRIVADRYIRNYFDFAYTLYPFVHRPTFMAAYEEIWSVNSTTLEVDELFYSILNIIFAFGCRLSPEGEHFDNSPNSDLYFERSQELLRFHLMDTGSVLLVQALLLTGQFLQATTRSAGCWNIIGLAIRIAQGLGLHSEQNLASTRSCIEKEIRKRLWHGCLLMDRIVSMTLGRPMMVTEDSGMQLPLGVDDEYISDTSILPSSRPSGLNFFLETVKLYDILADILKSFYSIKEPSFVNLYLSIFQFEERLHHFHENVPQHIKLGTELKEAPFERQSIVLQIRYLHLKIMLYRPVLFPKKRSSKKSEINTELYSNAHKSISLLCVETAIELITLITKFRAADINFLPASWYNVFYIYTAETVLLAAKLQPKLQNDLDVGVFETSWSQGLELLASYKNQSDSASRCLKVLEIMGEKVRFAESRLFHRPYPFDAVPSVTGSSANSSPSHVPSDVLYSLLYDTAGPFGGPFFYRDDLERYIN